MYYVYLWTNTVSGKQYVGKGCRARARAHFRKPSTLNAAMNKYGRENFELRYLATELDEATALAMERHAIHVLETKAPNGYNLTDGGEGASGRHLSEETRHKMSAAHKGKARPREAVERMAASHRGRKRSAEAKANISAGMTGRVLSPETRAKMSAVRKGRPGRPHSPETREKLRLAALDRGALNARGRRTE